MNTQEEISKEDAMKFFRYIKRETRKLPKWGKRQCRKQAIPLFRLGLDSMDARYFLEIKNLIKYWRAIKWNSVPPNLPKKENETKGRKAQTVTFSFASKDFIKGGKRRWL